MAWWKKVIAMAGGPSVNIAIAFFLFWGVFAFYGNPSEREVDAGQPVVAAVNDCVIPYEEQRTQCTDTDPVSPAAAAGLLRGDVITSFNGVAISDYDQLQELIRDNADNEAVIGFLRNGVAHLATTQTLSSSARPPRTPRTRRRSASSASAPRATWCRAVRSTPPCRWATPPS